MNKELTIKRLEIAIGFAQANSLDILDKNRDKGYWEGYIDALSEVKEEIEGAV